MPPRDWRLRFEDIVEAIDRVLAYTAGYDFRSFSADAKTVDAVIRNLEIIGEAARHIPKEVARRFPTVPWAQMTAMRNILVHGYFGVDLAIVWRTATKRLPRLRRAIRAALDTLE